MNCLLTMDTQSSDRYSQASKYSNEDYNNQRTVSTAMRDSPIKISEPKFLFCLSITNGVRIIGLLEVAATVLILLNMYYSYRVSIFLLVFFNIPLMVSWSLLQKAKFDNDYDEAYKWNTMFIRIYSVRFTVVVICGLIGIIIMSYSDGTSDFFCDRYYGIDYDLHETLKAKARAESASEIKQCRHVIRLCAILMYLPICLFQYHSIHTLNKYRDTVENEEKMARIDDDEDPI